MIAAAYLSETGPGRSVGVRLAILLSMGREEPHVTGAVLRLFEVEVSAEPELVKMAADFHREQGDVLGAVWWEARASVLR